MFSVASKILEKSLSDADSNIREILRRDLSDWNLESDLDWNIISLVRYIYFLIVENREIIEDGGEFKINDKDIRYFCGVTQDDDTAVFSTFTTVGEIAEQNITKTIVDRIVQDDSLDFDSQESLYHCVVTLFYRDFKLVIEKIMEN